MFTRLCKHTYNYKLTHNIKRKFNNLYHNYRSFSNVTTNSTEPTTSNNLSTFDKLYTYAKPLDIKGIWRAPRELIFTKEQFNKAYPDNYHGMRIGLPPPDSWMAKYINPKYDAISPILWTLLFISPILYYSFIHSLWEIGILPSNSHSH